MATLFEDLAIAVQHHQEGRLQTAEEIYRQILAADPDQVDALHLLGVAASQQGNHQAAVQYISRAIKLDGNEFAFHGNLGNAFRGQGELDKAVAAYRRALELKPDFAEAQKNLGNALKDAGKLEDAVNAYRRAVELKPDYAEAHNDLGIALQEQEKLDEAAASYRRAIELRVDYAEAHNNLGTVLGCQGKADDAVASYCRARELKPVYAEAHNNLGNAFQDQEKYDDAVRCFRRAIELKPDYAEAHSNLGNALQALGKLDDAIAFHRLAIGLKPAFAEAHNKLGSAFKEQGEIEEAVQSYRRALELKPAYAEAHSNLGNAFQPLGKLDEAVASYRRALELKPDYAEAYSNLGTACQSQGKLDEAVACLRRAVELKPEFSEAFSNLLLTLQYQAGTTPAELLAAHAEYDRLHAVGLRKYWKPHANSRDAERRLLVGFVSPDFGHHPVGNFLIRAMENIDRGRFEIACYSDRIIKDELTKRFEANATIWRDVRALSDGKLTEQIRADRIDILLDLAGHTARNRLLVFARKPAPIQVTWAGYVGTTGLKAMDYILADRYEIPPGAEVNYCERVLRMPDGYVCYEPPAYAPAVAPLAALQQGFVTFGSFNNRPKITSKVVEVWAQILKGVPQSRLVLKNRGMNDVSNAGELVKVFASHGIDPERVEYLGWSPHEALLAEYGRIDLALDTFPYNGGLTTCEALWMGVPVITCPGETFASRHSLSHLSNIGLTETVGRDWGEYVKLAVSLASDLPRLAALRAELRARMAASPLCDGRRFGDNLMQVLRDLWHQWCHKGTE